MVIPVGTVNPLAIVSSVPERSRMTFPLFGPGKPGALSKDLQFDVEAFKNFLKLRAEVEGSWGGKPPAAEKFYDLSYYRKALAMVNK